MRNIRFLIDGTEIEMGNNSLSLQLKNPMFEDVGSHSLPIKIPRTPSNDAVIKSFHPGIISSTVRFPAQLFIGPIPFQGECVLSSISEKYYEGHFTIGNATFRDIAKDVKLSDIDYTEIITGSTSVSFTDALETAARSSHPTHNYTCFPILDHSFYNGYNYYDYSILINPWTFNPFSNPATEGFFANIVYDSRLIYAPSFYLCFVIQKVFEEFGYTIENNDIYNDTEMRTLVIPNFYINGGMQKTYRQYDLTFSDALPPVGVNDFISGLEQIFNLTFFFSERDNTVNIKKNTSIVKALPQKELNLISRERQFEEHNGFLLNYTMDPDDPFSEIKSIDNYEVGLTIDNKEDLSSYDASNYRNQLAKITNNDYYYLSALSDNEIETWEWEFYTNDFFEYSEGGKSLEIFTNINPILTDNDTLNNFDVAPGSQEEHAIYPRIEMAGTGTDFHFKNKTFSSVRLLFYRGIVDSGGRVNSPTTQYGQYPLASSDVYKAAGLTSPNRYGRTKITSANMSLRWGGTYGLHETHWKDFLYWYQNIKRPAKDRYDMSLQEFLSIEFWEKYRADEQSFLFRSINLDVDFARDTCRVGECEVYLS